MQQFLLIAFSIAIPLVASAKSTLPICPNIAQTSWNNCFAEYTYSGGIKYKGEFQNGLRHGLGTITWPSGNSYEGEWRNGNRNGAGTYRWASGARYTGEHRENTLHGRGVYTGTDGRVFVGAFREDKRSGEGIEYGKDGAVLRSGLWESDSLKQAYKLEPSRFSATSGPPKNDQLSSTIESKPSVPAAVLANRKALIIGNDAYTRVSPLLNAVADANAMESALRSVGFTTFKHLNVTEKTFKAALREFKLRVDPGDEVLVFYSGHGIQVANENYLLPVDFNLRGENEDQVRDEAIQLQRLLDDMQEKKAKFTLAVIDACRDNPLPKKGNGRSIGTSRGLAPTTPAKGQMIMYAAGKDQQALDRLSDRDPVKNGVFTRVFIREMQKPGVTVDRVLRNVRSQVVEMAKSVGHEQTPAIYDESTGDFYFKR